MPSPPLHVRLMLCRNCATAQTYIDGVELQALATATTPMTLLGIGLGHGPGPKPRRNSRRRSSPQARVLHPESRPSGIEVLRKLGIVNAFGVVSIGLLRLLFFSSSLTLRSMISKAHERILCCDLLSICSDYQPSSIDQHPLMLVQSPAST